MRRSSLRNQHGPKAKAAMPSSRVNTTAEQRPSALAGALSATGGGHGQRAGDHQRASRVSLTALFVTLEVVTIDR